MCFEHERIHIETSSVLMRELPLEFVREPESWPALGTSQANWEKPTKGVHFRENPLIELAEAQVTLGKKFDEVSYGWDNEYGAKTITVPRFNASAMQISNGEFYEFVMDGGYRDPSLWSDDGWGWVCFRNVRRPTFWREDGPQGLNQYTLRTVFREVPMQWDWPAIVNYHEAKAYCAWKTRQEQATVPYRVLSEAEHWRLRESDSYDAIMHSNNPDNTNLVSGAERAVDGGAPNSMGFHDVFGNAWDWCEDHQSPLPGFEIHHLYDDFTLPCFDGEHNMIMGGSFVSTGDQASIYARYQFRPHFFQHAGFRLAQPLGEPWLTTSCMGSEGPYASAQSPYRKQQAWVQPPSSSTNNEEVAMDEKELSRYLNLHFPSEVADTPEWVPTSALDFPNRCAQLLIETAVDAGVGRVNALDLGCGVGGSSFGLAHRIEGYSSVTGVEKNAALVQVSNQLKKHGNVEYDLYIEGEHAARTQAVVSSEVDRERVTFLQGDVTSPDPIWQTQYDAVLLGNLLDRISAPRQVLSNIQQLVAPNGLLMVTSGFGWSSQVCPPEEWLGGRQTGERSQHVVAGVLQNNGFRPINTGFDMPLLIRDHARSYQLLGMYTSLWQRKSK